MCAVCMHSSLYALLDLPRMFVQMSITLAVAPPNGEARDALRDAFRERANRARPTSGKVSLFRRFYFPALLYLVWETCLGNWTIPL